MEEKKIQCPSCGGPNAVMDYHKEQICVFCSSSFIPKEVEEKITKVRPENYKTYNWMVMAETARDGGNYEEAIKYYNKILEENSSHSASWFGKGSAIIWSSTLGDIKMSEALNYFKNAIKFSKSNSMKHAVATELNAIVDPFYSKIRSHYKEFYELDGTMEEFNDRFIILEFGLNFGLEIDPQNETLIDTGLYLVNDIDATLHYVFREIYHYDDILNKYINAKKKTNPSWEPGPDPKIERDNKRNDSNTNTGNCFIATATMGDYNHPTVKLLRIFRNNYLLRRNWGMQFTNIYYKWGPYPARIIAKNKILRKISYITIVKPLSIIASILLKKNNSV